jgi:hypothetical protein
MQFVQNNMGAFARAGLIGFAIIIIVITGVILMIVLRKKFVFEHHEGELEKGSRFSTVVCNVGIAVYIIFWAATIILTQFGIGLSPLLDKLLS